MSAFLLASAIVLLLTIGGGLVRVWRGPSGADRMLSAQFFGTTGVAMFLVLAEVFDRPPLRDTALIDAILAALVMVAFVKHAVLQRPERDAR